MPTTRYRAFTIVEILIVLAVICLLAAVTIPTFVQALKDKKAREEKASQPAAETATDAHADTAMEAGAGTQ